MGPSTQQFFFPHPMLLSPGGSFFLPFHAHRRTLLLAGASVAMPCLPADGPIIALLIIHAQQEASPQ
jgi:hypothetical protein